MSVPSSRDGQYWINPSGGTPSSSYAFPVFCEMTTLGGGWTFFGHYDNSNVAYTYPIQCSSVTLVNDIWRRTTWGGNFNGVTQCDNNKFTNLYLRFQDSDGFQFMADNYVPTYQRCGSDLVGWFSGTHPTVASGEVSFVSYFSNGGTTTNWGTTSYVIQCAGFYAYRLPNMSPGCNGAICTSTVVPTNFNLKNTGASLSSTFFGSNFGTYDVNRGDNDLTYSKAGHIGLQMSHTQMMVTIDTPIVSLANSTKKLVMFQYAAGHIAFNSCPTVCNGLSKLDWQYSIGTQNSWKFGDVYVDCFLQS